MKKRSLQLLAMAAALLFVTSVFTPVASAQSTAVDITKSCRFVPSSSAGMFKRAVDGRLATKWVSAKAAERHIDITIQPDSKAGAVYFRWDRAPASWELFAFEKDGSLTSALKGGGEGYLTDYEPIPAQFNGYKVFRLELYAGQASDVSLSELSVYTPGAPPPFAPEWQTFAGRVDLLTVAAHPDDEDLYLGMPAPTYTDEGKKCETVFMTYGSKSHSARRFEAQESVWSLGNRYYPEMGSFPDVKAASKIAEMKRWKLKKVVGFIVEQIRKYKPAVIVTHDVNGEYGHGAHRLTQYATALAFQESGDPAQYPDSAAKYGAWKAGKLYVHLYAQNRLNPMDTKKRLKSYGGRTVLQVVKDAYHRHKSQLPGRSLPISGRYDMRRFGLFATNLGPDSKHDSMFENVSDGAMLALNPWYNPEDETD